MRRGVGGGWGYRFSNACSTQVVTTDYPAFPVTGVTVQGNYGQCQKLFLTFYFLSNIIPGRASPYMVKIKGSVSSFLFYFIFLSNASSMPAPWPDNRLLGSFYGTGKYLFLATHFNADNRLRDVTRLPKYLGHLLRVRFFSRAGGGVYFISPLFMNLLVC